MNQTIHKNPFTVKHTVYSEEKTIAQQKYTSTFGHSFLFVFDSQIPGRRNSNWFRFQV